MLGPFARGESFQLPPWAAPPRRRLSRSVPRTAPVHGRRSPQPRAVALATRRETHSRAQRPPNQRQPSQHITLGLQAYRRVCGGSADEDRGLARARRAATPPGWPRTSRPPGGHHHFSSEAGNGGGGQRAHPTVPACSCRRPVCWHTAHLLLCTKSHMAKKLRSQTHAGQGPLLCTCAGLPGRRGTGGTYHATAPLSSPLFPVTFPGRLTRPCRVARDLPSQETTVTLHEVAADAGSRRGSARGVQPSATGWTVSPAALRDR